MGSLRYPDTPQIVSVVLLPLLLESMSSVSSFDGVGCMTNIGYWRKPKDLSEEPRVARGTLKKALFIRLSTAKRRSHSHNLFIPIVPFQ